MIQNILTQQELQVLLELICSEQTNGVIKRSGFFTSQRYKDLESLKIKIKKMRGESDDF